MRPQVPEGVGPGDEFEAFVGQVMVPHTAATDRGLAPADTRTMDASAVARHTTTPSP